MFAAARLRLFSRQLAGLVREIDADANGTVSLDEFEAWLKSRSGAARAVRRQLALTHGELAVEQVEEADEAITEADALEARAAAAAAGVRG